MVCTFRISTCILLSFIGFLGAEEGRKPSGCGIRYDMGTRIVGGTSSHPGRWPWMAAMYRGSIHYCGGVLITDRHILTAAHCVARYNLHTITIRLGDFDLSKDEPIPHHIGHEITVGIRRAVIHKDYNAKLFCTIVTGCED
ncbi:serine protease 33-like [Artemia franciscana]|uniref:serine protease 33-like n=1 Tax=Artemia franciscana TaxID=6661 RepID=UPI0032DA75B7